MLPKRRYGYRQARATCPLRVELLESRHLLSADLAFVGLDPLLTGKHPTADPSLVDTATSTLSSATSVIGLAAPAYHSDPTAPIKLFLDFDGRVEVSWGLWSNVVTPAFDLDGDLLTFNASELDVIHQIWTRVAEDYAPFRIDVTTVDPLSTANGQVAVVAIGGLYSDWYGSSAGGVAYVGGFSNSSPNVAYVFSGNLSGNAKYISEAAAHEAGHLFGLQHQAVWSGSTLVTEYNSGDGNWAPLMGVGYYATRTTWYNGATSAGPNALQDDMAVIGGSANKFGFRPDDYGNAVGTAALLPLSGANVEVSGIIGMANDQDVWAFATDVGTISFQLVGAQYGTNLDAVLELWNSSGAVIASAAPSTSLGAVLTATVAGGNYYLVARGMGDYGDVGRYSISGTIVLPATTVAAPSNLVASTGSTTLIRLQWTDNAANETGYEVERSLDGIAWSKLTDLPANSQNFDDSTGSPGTAYLYRVKAVSDGTTSLYSNVAAATTISLAPLALTATTISGSRIDLAWTDVSGDGGYKIERSADGFSWTQIAATAQNVVSYQDSGLSAATTYYYRVRATNAGGDSEYSNVASAQTQEAVGVPEAPSDLVAGAGSRTVTLNWIDRSGNETGFSIERSNGNGSFSVIATVGADSTSFTESVPPRKTLYYRVRAFNDGGYSAYSDTAVVVTLRSALVEDFPTPSNSLIAASEPTDEALMLWLMENQDVVTVPRVSRLGC